MKSSHNDWTPTFQGCWSDIENSKSIQVDSASKKLLLTTSGFFCRFLVWDFFLTLFFLKALKWADHEGKAEHLFFFNWNCFNGFAPIYFVTLCSHKEEYLGPSQRLGFFCLLLMFSWVLKDPQTAIWTKLSVSNCTNVHTVV